jgi:hypothetical protein
MTTTKPKPANEGSKPASQNIIPGGIRDRALRAVFKRQYGPNWRLEYERWRRLVAVRAPRARFPA